MKRSFFVALSLSLFLFACGTNAGRDNVDGGTGTEADAGGGDASGGGDGGGLDAGGADATGPDATPTDAGPADAGGPCLDPNDPAVTYVSEDPDGCFELDCGPNASVFTNPCGCGCLEAPATCSVEWDSPLYQQVGGSPEICAVIDYVCEDGGEYVGDDCGCGCYYAPPICPDPEWPGVSYVGESPAECELIDFDCAEDFFDGPCGCGCISGETGVCDIDWDSPVYWYYDELERGCMLDDWACPEGSTYIDDDCSCGCYFGPDVCPDPEDPTVEYFSDDPDECSMIDLDCDSFYTPCGCGCFDEEPPACDVDWDSPLNQQVGGSPEECAVIFFGCEDGGEMVADDCGCGCAYEPPVCPDPSELGVSYIGESPEECADIDWDCFSPDAESFDGPCGCGCVESACPDPDAPNIQYVAEDPETCAVIDYVCPEGWVGFGGGECGCGCEVTECRDDIIFGTSGLTEEFGVGNFCDFLLTCSPLSLEMSGIVPVVTELFGDDAASRCFDRPAFGCPEGTRSSCEFVLGEVTEADVVDVCALSLVASIDRILCGGDL